MAIRRVALIFDSVQRPETTGVYCHRALGRLVEVTHFQPGELERIPRRGFDLYLNIDDGLRYHLPPELHPSAWWAIDTHLDLAWANQKAQGFDLVFAAQRDGAEELRNAGITSAAWLPLACDPEIHGKHDVAKLYAVAFVGHVFPGPRAELLELIRRKFPDSFIGQRYFEEMARIYSAARMVFNRSIKSDLNMRVFEGLASGSLLLTNDLGENGLDQLFRDGTHLAAYREADDLVDKIEYYLRREKLRERIAAVGRAEVLEKHTYGHRMEQVLRQVEAALAGIAVPVTGVQANRQSPGWGGIVEPGVLTPGIRSPSSSSPGKATRASAEVYTMSPRWGSTEGREGDRTPQPAAHAAGYVMPPRRGSESRGSCDTPPPAAHAAGYVMSPRRGSESRGSCDTPPPAAHAAGYVMPPRRGSPDAPDRCMTPAAGHNTQDPFYFGHARPEVLILVPETARAVLDIGCGSGRLGEALKVRQRAEVVGIELNEAAAAAARTRLDRVIVGDVETLAVFARSWEGEAPAEPQWPLPARTEPRSPNWREDGHSREGEAPAEPQRPMAARTEPRPPEITQGHLDPPFPSGRFDAIVCGDILEHLRDPDCLLRQARTWLAPDGALVASIPNVRHHSVVRSVLEGNWTYESAGLLDRTHLRFFTRREIEKLFFRAGFTIDEMRSVIGPGDRDVVGNLGGTVQVGRLAIGGLSEREAAEFYTYQYLIRARPATVPDFGTTSIVIVTHNQLEYTRQCLDSINRLTDEAYELIVVDNGSSDGTVEYVRSLSGVQLIVNDANRGFPAAANQGMAVATGRQILLLNNDVVVTTGWLFRLLRALHGDPAIGLVGPCSNFVSGPQQVETRYDSLADLDGFAWDWGGAHEGVRVDVNRLVGFCLLIRREVVEAIGLLDEHFGVGCFEDDDYCLRAIQAGYRAVIAGDAFVHHFGGRTFVGTGVDCRSLLRENEQRFREKWAGLGQSRLGERTVDANDGAGRLAAGAADGDLRSGPRAGSGDPRPALRPGRGSGDPLPALPTRPLREAPGPFAIDVAPAGGLRMRIEADRPRISLCMIVRDNARTLPACLESIRPWVDEMVIVDTGSVDETPRIVESFGGRLFHFPWCDDFSAARNESLRHARGDWLFWMDSDDTIPPDCGRGMRGLVDREVPPPILGFIMQVHCPGLGEDGGPDFDVTMVDHVKLFRNRPELRFDHRIHEQILPAIRVAGGEVAWTDFYVVHSGSDQSPEGQAKKLERDLRILHRELAERPEHPFTLFNLGMTYCHASRYAEAVDYLRRGIARSGSGEPHLRKASGLLAFALMRLVRHDEAMETLRRGRALFPRDTELRFREGVLLHELGHLHEARQAYLDVLNHGGDERHFSSVDRALTGFKVRQNLAVVASDMGDLAEAERQWREVLREVPRYRQGWRGMGETMLRAGRFAELDSLADNLTTLAELRVEGLLMKSRTAKTQGVLTAAREALDRALADRPDDWVTLCELSQFLFEHGTTDEADAALKALLDRRPDDASAHHNRGVLMMKAQRYDEAVQAYQTSLQYRPNYVGTCLNLGYALKDSGRLDEAARAWQEAARLAPNDPTARTELAGLSLRERVPESCEAV